MAGFAGDPHTQPGSDCPRNFLGITDFGILTRIEVVFVNRRITELIERSSGGSFDANHLRSIHRYIFQDVFPWAGEFRVVNISKGSTNFGHALHIAGALAELLDKLKREDHLKGLGPADFAQRAGFYLGEINAIHPFREGNGRTQREFIRQLALAAGHPLSWAGFTQQEMIAASIAAHTRDEHSQMASIVERSLYSSRSA